MDAQQKQGEINAMKIKLSDEKFHEVRLCDDGTLDTVVSVDGQETRFNQEYTAEMRNPKTGELPLKSLIELAEEVLEDVLTEEALEGEQCQQNING